MSATTDNDKLFIVPERSNTIDTLIPSFRKSLYEGFGNLEE
jgi:hypothetical protein